MRTIQAGCFNRGCTLRDAEFFWRSCNKQDSQYCRNQATLNIQVAKRFLTEKARQGDWWMLGSCCCLHPATGVQLTW